MEQDEEEKTPICKIVCQWIIQIILWISFSIFIISSGYKLKLVVLENIYSPGKDENGAPLYGTNWSNEELNNFFTPSLIIWIGTYIVYLISEFLSPSYKFFGLKKKEKTMYELMNYFFSAKPKIIFTASCYHYVTKTKTEYDSNGRLRNNTYEEKVITHYDTLTLPYYSSRDVSGPFVLNLKKVGNVDFVKLHLKLSIDFADSVSFIDYYNARDNFYNKNKYNYKDTYFDFDEKRSIPEFSEDHFVKITDEKTSISRGWYTLAIILGFAEFYKSFVSTRSIEQTFTIVKLISTRYNLLQQSGFTEMQPRLDLGKKKYSFNENKTGYCGDNKVELPSEEEIKLANEKYGNLIPKYSMVNNNGINYVTNLIKNGENYKEKITTSIRNNSNERNILNSNKITEVPNNIINDDVSSKEDDKLNG